MDRKTIERANDHDPNVQVEIRAAQIGNSIDHKGWELEGFYAHNWNLDHGLDDQRTHQFYWLAGWLSRELRTHDSRESRDADAWPWDPTRPVEGQYEEYLAVVEVVPLGRRGHASWCMSVKGDTGACDCDGDSEDEIAEHDQITRQTRHDVAASVARHAELDAIEYETERAAEPDCRDDDDADQRIIEALVRIGEDRAPGPLTADQVIAAAHAEDAAYAEAALEDGVSEAMVELATERVPS